MEVPLQVAYRDVAKTEALEQQIRDEAAKLEQVCDYMTSCRIAVEKPHEHQKQGNPYRVRLEMHVPPGHDLVVEHGAQDSEMHAPLHTVLKDAFSTARRRLKELVERQRGTVKHHPDQELGGIVEKLFREEGYGFIRTVEGQEIYFHRNSVLNDDFDRLDVGTGVRFVTEEGEKGPQASTVQIIDKPGSRT